MAFQKFSKAQFERILTIIAKECGVFWKDITDEYRKENPGTWERIYEFSTNKGFAKIWVFSSVDITTGSTRDYAEDRVRSVYVWKTRNGNLFHKGEWRNRVRGLEDNLKETITGMLATIAGSADMGKIGRWNQQVAE